MRIQSLTPSQRVAGRWLAGLEDGTILRVGENEVVSFSLYAGKELDEGTLEGLKAAAHASRLKEKALNLLAVKPMSRKALEGKLAQWEASPEETEALCSRLEELGYLDDARYGAMVARHYSRKGYGPAKIREELYRRGVPRELWDDAVAEMEDTDQALDAFLDKKLKGGPLPDDPRERKRLTDACARRGFSWQDISQAMARRGGGWED